MDSTKQIAPYKYKLNQRQQFVSCLILSYIQLSVNIFFYSFRLSFVYFLLSFKGLEGTSSIFYLAIYEVLLFLQFQDLLKNEKKLPQRDYCFFPIDSINNIFYSQASQITLSQLFQDNQVFFSTLFNLLSKNLTTSLTHSLGRLSLCPPFTIRIYLSSPPQAQNNCFVCSTGTIQSFLPTIKKQGTSIVGTTLQGSSSQILKFAFYWIVPEMIFKAPLKSKLGILTIFYAIHSTKVFKLLKGLSTIAAFIPLLFPFLARQSKVVTAPIDLPQSAILLILGYFLRQLITSSKSSCS